MIPTMKLCPDYFTICVEGLIGAGKSSLISQLSDHPLVAAFAEAVPDWQNVSLPKEEGGSGDVHNVLQLYYGDMNRWGGSFQALVALSKLSQHLRPIAPKPVKIMEGSLHSSHRVFCTGLARKKLIPEPDAAMCSRLYHFALEHHYTAAHKYIYLDVTPEVALARIKVRGRPEESGVTLDYLQELHASYATMFSGPEFTYSYTPIDANGDQANILKLVKSELSFLLGDW